MHSLLISRVGGLEIDIGRRESFRDSLASALPHLGAHLNAAHGVGDAALKHNVSSSMHFSTPPFPVWVSVLLPTRLVSAWGCTFCLRPQPVFLWRPRTIRSCANRKWFSCCFVGVVSVSGKVSGKNFAKTEVWAQNLFFYSNNWLFNLFSEHFDGKEVDAAPKYSHNHNQFPSVLIVCSVEQEKKPCDHCFVCLKSIFNATISCDHWYTSFFLIYMNSWIQKFCIKLYLLSQVSLPLLPTRWLI